jgi:hypothetical protein
MQVESNVNPKIEPEPRWPTAVAMLAIGGLFYALPPAMTVGPDWLALALVAVLITPATIFHRKGMHRANQFFGYLAQGVVTVYLAASLVMLVYRLPAHKETPAELLRAAAALWVSNMLVFASWLRKEMGEDQWRPGFVDYLFLAFNTSTAFSPTDVPVLSRWAKVLMMIQSAISLTAIAILAARAVNIL